MTRQFPAQIQNHRLKIGKVRDKFMVSAGTAQDLLAQQAQALPGIRKWIEGHPIAKIIALQDKLVNIVIT